MQNDIGSSDKRALLVPEDGAVFGPSGRSAAPGHLEASLAEPAEVGQSEGLVVALYKEPGGVVGSRGGAPNWRNPLMQFWPPLSNRSGFSILPIRLLRQSRRTRRAALLTLPAVAPKPTRHTSRSDRTSEAEPD